MSHDWLSASFHGAFMHGSNPHTPEGYIENDRKKFFHAVQKEDLDTMQAVRQKYGSATLKFTSDEGSVLHTAQSWGCFISFVTLLSMGCDVNEDYGNGWTPLTTALARNDQIFLPYLLERRADPNVTATDSKGREVTALKLAIDLHDGQTVRTLIELGADAKKEITDKDGTKMSPADYATKKRLPQIAEMLNLADQIRALRAHELDGLTPVEGGGQPSAPKPAPGTPAQGA